VEGTKLGYTYPEDPHMALVHNNINPAQAVFSIGTSFTGVETGGYSFTPSASGLVNPDFSRVTADGKVYCFETSLNGYKLKLKERILRVNE